MVNINYRFYNSLVNCVITENVHVTEGTIMANYYNPKLATGIYLVVLTDNKGIRFVEKVLLRD
jgi:hypothetical protein